MKIKLDPTNPQTWPKGRINAARVDSTTQSELAAQQAVDDANATQDTDQAAQGNFSACALNNLTRITV